ncbi:MAG: TIGR01777 family oxidoreductase [Desulfobacterales bacterium]|nr:TIGR01777 family oxidoreductase [Desulfobacterales bacterium]
MKTILITGASGFVGSHLSRYLLENGYAVIGLGTSARHRLTAFSDNFTWVSTDTTQGGSWQSHVPSADIIINLAGRSIFKPWTRTYKQAIYDSRVRTTRNLVDAMGEAWSGQLLSTSAVGFYGDRGDTLVSETDPCGKDFLAEVCRDWEGAASAAVEKGARVSIMRFGVVLGDGGALSVMGTAFKSFVGGPLGTGQQWFPWIHISDLIEAVDFLISGNHDGKFNFSGPSPIRQKAFAKALGRALGRPAIMPAPAFMVKTVMGELGASLLQSQKAQPDGLNGLGYRFRYPDAAAALADIYKNR